MPEFVLDHGTPDAAEEFAKLDSFTQGYIEAMFFTETNGAEDADMANATFANLAPVTLAAIAGQCQRFQTENASLLGEAYSRDYSEEQAGRDLWFNRNGHGVGYWDRDVLDDNGLGERLSERAEAFGGQDIYVGDDGSLYVG